MRCQHLSQKALLPNRWHALWCAECRAARAADATLSLGVECMRAHPVPVTGLTRALSAVGLVSTSLPRSARVWSALRRFALPAGALTVFAALMGYGWLCTIDADPDITVWTPKPPSPNAFDFYRGAGAALLDDPKISYALTNKPAPQKAAEKLPAIQASRFTGRTSSGQVSVNTVPPAPSEKPQDHVYTLAEKIALVQENANALQLLRQGFAYPYQEPPTRSFKVLFPYYATYRSLARLLALDAQVKVQQGDWQGAANSDLDAMQLGAEIPHGALLEGKLVGIACEAIGRQPLWSAIEHLNAKQARAAIRRLAIIQRDHAPVADNLDAEKWATLANLQSEVFRQPGWRLEFAKLNQDGTANSEDFQLPRYLSLLRYSKRQILERYIHYMDQEIAAVRQPGVTALPQIEVPDDPVSGMLAPAFSQVRFADQASEAQNALLRTVLALRAYWLEHGVYPQALYQLVPYLAATPKDPFTDRQTLQYQRTGKTYLLYSVGPDGKDDGGTPIRNAQAHSDVERDHVEQNSVGDIVAGINTK
jgi:hypothetical protein